MPFVLQNWPDYHGIFHLDVYLNLWADSRAKMSTHAEERGRQMKRNIIYILTSQPKVKRVVTELSERGRQKKNSSSSSPFFIWVNILLFLSLLPSALSGDPFWLNLNLLLIFLRKFPVLRGNLFSIHPFVIESHRQSLSM